jgi:hypothetical protein
MKPGVYESPPSADEWDGKGGGAVMRVWATILVLVTSAVGFVFSYEIAYRKVVKLMQSSSEQTQVAHTQPN